MTNEERIHELEYTVRQLQDQVHGLQVMVEGHDEELAIVDHRLNDIEGILERLHWSFHDEEPENPYQK